MRMRFCLIVLLLAAPNSHAQDVPLSQIVIPGEGWKKVDGTFETVSSLSSRAVDAATVLMVWDKNHKLQAVLDGEGKIIKPKFGDLTNRPDIAQTGNDFAYVLTEDKKALRLVRNPLDKETIKEFKLPVTQVSTMAGLRGRNMLLIADAADKYVWVFRSDPDGNLAAGDRYIALRVRKGETRSEACSIRLDSAGRFYVATREGVQIFDPTGRLCGVLLNPSRELPTAMTFGGAKGDMLFLACGKEIFFRKLSTPWAYFKSAEKK